MQPPQVKCEPSPEDPAGARDNMFERVAEANMLGIIDKGTLVNGARTLERLRSPHCDTDSEGLSETPDLAGDGDC